MFKKIKIIKLVMYAEAYFSTLTLNDAVENKSFDRASNHGAVTKLLDVVFDRLHTLSDTDKVYGLSFL